MRSTRCAAALAVVAALSLAACGSGIPIIHDIIEGGDNGDENGRPGTTEPPAMSSAEIKAEIAAIYRRSNTLIEEEDRHPLFGPQRYASSIPTWFSLREELEGEYEFLAAERGLSTAIAAWSTMDRPWSLQAHLTFGGWMEHSFFLVNETVSASARHDSVSVYLDIFSIGAASSTNPTAAGGSATWIGIMVGFDESLAGPGISRLEHEEDNLYLGNATLTIDDFAMPEVDVHFTDVANAESGRRLRDVSWFDLPVNAGGFEGRGILGRFYGPAHEEVGGVFQFGTVNGAFGAVRQ